MERDFDFPYPPYDIQLQLMNVLYDSFDKSKISIVESPTGTGKSLSIICSVLKWLKDFKRNQIEHLTRTIENLKAEIADENSDDWISGQLKQISANNQISDLNVQLETLNKHVNYCKELKKKVKLRKSQQYVSKETNKRATDLIDIETGDDYDLVVQFCDEEDIAEEEKETKEYFQPKVYYCSRTHSQLSQFINEFKKTKSYADKENSIMLVPLSSRVNYCTNPSVNRFTNINIINEKCSDLQSSKQKCPLYKQAKLEHLREEILANLGDIEEIVNKSKQVPACPYYSSKMAIPDAEIVVLPYNTLLHKGTRESFGIQLKNSIVIIDEAHNLLETIASVYSIEIKSFQVSNLLKYVSLYVTKYYTRFNSHNLMYLKQLMFILKRLLKFLQSPPDQKVTYDPLDFTLQMEIENINVYKLNQFIDQSRLASKLHMFSNKFKVDSQTSKKPKTSGTLEFLKKIKGNTSDQSPNYEQETNDKSPEDEFLNTNTLYVIRELLHALTNFSINGKVLLNINKTNTGDSSLKYVLLSPSSHIKELLNECRSVILCGGTMKPFEDYFSQLFKPLSIPDERILTFSCSHVISPDKLISIGCSRGPSGQILNYSFGSRSKGEVVRQTGDLLVELCQVIPKGVVVFFPSYDYQEFLLNQWQKSGTLRAIERHNKRIFREPKKASLVPTVLMSYTKFLKSSPNSGAVIFSVIGGKMSEGINFSDDLGRGVIVVGLPYANKNSVELQEKMSYLNGLGSGLGNEYYENLCMRAVNQSIGRAIRHREDYAAIVLLDQRYSTKHSVRSKLPNWIQARHSSIDNFAQVISQVKRFFDAKKSH